MAPSVHYQPACRRSLEQSFEGFLQWVQRWSARAISAARSSAAAPGTHRAAWTRRRLTGEAGRAAAPARRGAEGSAARAAPGALGGGGAAGGGGGAGGVAAARG